MARRIATITGTGLRPGVSRNRRWYKPEHVADAVKRAQERLASGEKPMVMLTFHGAEDNSREIAASLTGMRLAEDGSAEFDADFADTPAGWDIAKLADTTDGKPAHLKNVSIRGAWVGKVRRERGPDGQLVETGDGLELDGIDFTRSPGVDGAEIKTFAWATESQNETTERVLITESVEAAVTFTEETGPQAPAAAAMPDGTLEAVRALLEPAVTEAHALDNGLCVTCGGDALEEARKGRNKQPYGDVTYADPGYQKDKVKRYPLDTTSHVRSAWSYINMPKNAAKYTSDQLKRIKGRIKAAMKRLGAKVSAETAGWVVGEPARIGEAVVEWMGDSPSRSGSWSISASNGPVNLNLSSYCMDPADLEVILRAAADAACKALAALDPDMDGDIDVPGADDADTDGDGGKGESAPPATTTGATDGTGSESPQQRETTEEGGASVTAETTSQQGGSAPSTVTEADLAKAREEAAREAVEAYKAQQKAERKAAKKAARKATEAAQGAGVAETSTEKPEGTVTESQEEREKRLIAAALEAAGVKPAVQETEDQRVARLVQEGVTAYVQEAIAGGAVIPGRTGMVVREHRTDPDAAPDAEALSKMSDDDFQAFAGKNLDAYLGDNSSRIQSVTQ